MTSVPLVVNQRKFNLNSMEVCIGPSGGTNLVSLRTKRLNKLSQLNGRADHGKLCFRISISEITNINSNKNHCNKRVKKTNKMEFQGKIWTTLSLVALV